jgi:hypothetical protein
MGVGGGGWGAGGRPCMCCLASLFPLQNPRSHCSCPAPLSVTFPAPQHPYSPSRGPFYLWEKCAASGAGVDWEGHH